MLKFQAIVKNSKGITIIELLIVILLISTIGVMSTSFYSRFLTQNTVDNVTTQLVNSFRKAQIYSMTGKQTNTWGVKYTTSPLPKKITIYLTGNSAFDESFIVSPNITITGFTDISFARVTGIPSAFGTITISGNNSSKTITINNQGTVSKTN